MLTAGRIPKSLVIIGGGAIGCEYGSIYAALGTDVTIVDIADHLLPFLDAELSERAAATYKQAGVRLILNAQVSSVKRVNGVLTVTLGDGTQLRRWAQKVSISSI